MKKQTFPVHSNTTQEIGLFEAAKRGDVKGIKKQIEAGASPNALDGRDNPWDVTPLMYAAKSGHVASVRLLLDMGSKVAAKDKGIMGYGGGRMPIHYAVADNVNVDVVSTLIEAGADADAVARAMPFTPLLGAVGKNALDVVALLVKLGVSVEARNKNSQSTALMIASADGSVECMKILLKAKPDVNAKDKTGDSAISFAVLGGHMDAVRLLAGAGADLGVVDLQGKTLLHKAVFSEDKIMLGEIIRLSPNLVSIKDKRGLTALDTAIQGGYRSAAAVLKGV